MVATIPNELNITQLELKDSSAISYACVLDSYGHLTHSVQEKPTLPGVSLCSGVRKRRVIRRMAFATLFLAYCRHIPCTGLVREVSTIP